MANSPQTEQDLQTPESTEAVGEARTPRRTITHELRRIIGEIGAALGIGILARIGTPKGQEQALNFSRFKAARDAGLVHGDAPSRLAAYQTGEEASLRGEELQEAA